MLRKSAMQERAQCQTNPNTPLGAERPGPDFSMSLKVIPKSIKFKPWAPKGRHVRHDASPRCRQAGIFGTEGPMAPRARYYKTVQNRQMVDCLTRRCPAFLFCRRRQTKLDRSKNKQMVNNEIVNIMIHR